jgi:hypothetical protein
MLYSNYIITRFCFKVRKCCAIGIISDTYVKFLSLPQLFQQDSIAFITVSQQQFTRSFKLVRRTLCCTPAS